MNTWSFLEHLHRVQQRLFEGTLPLLRDHGLPASTLWMLGAVGRCAYPSEIGRELGLPAPSVSRLLKGLEADGYIARETVPEDLRRFRIRLTPKGEALRAEARRCVESAMDALLQRLSPEERGELDRLLARLDDGETAHERA